MQTPLERVRNYFQEIANSFAAEKLASAVFDNPSDKGTIREDILKNFLVAHLPARCRVIKGGYIFGSLNEQSKQIDIIVINDLTLQFNQFDKSFNCIEGSYCAISVKSNLNRDELIDSLQNLASIPQMPDMTENISPLVANRSHYNNLPACVVFAYDGLSLETIYNHMKDFYEANPAIPNNRKPQFVIVNNKYAIVLTSPSGGSYRDGTQLPPNAYLPEQNDYVGGLSLLRLITLIQSVASMGTHISFSFQNYIDAIPF